MEQITKSQVYGLLTDLENKQDVISDLATIRSGAEKGATAEAKMTIVAASGTTLTASVDNYYLFSSEVNTLAITLTTPTDTTNITKAIFMLTTGSSPAVTFSSSSPIDYFASYEIEANTSYEINALWNGSRWIIGATEINVTPSNNVGE